MKRKVDLSDFHIHTQYSFDSKEKIDSICEAAIKAGLSSIAITNHYDHDGIEEKIYPPYCFDRDAEDIIRAKEKYKDKLNVYMGLEIGQPHTMTDKKIAKIESLKYEFIIGSLHNMRNCFDFYFLDYKKTTSEYDRGIFKKSLGELMEIAECGFIDTIGHITYPERYMKEAGKDLDYSEFEEDFSCLFEKMAKNKVALELNTSGMRQGLGRTMPKTDVLSVFLKSGGEYITIGSDSHYAEHVGNGVLETYEMVKKYGFIHINEIRRKK